MRYIESSLGVFRVQSVLPRGSGERRNSIVLSCTCVQEDSRQTCTKMAATHLDVGLRCIKYLLCAVNSLFVLTGIMIISIGTTIYTVNDDFSYFLDPKYISPATLLVIVGILVFVIAFLGCFGALRESTCMVLVFAVSLSLVLTLELAAAITAYALQDDIKNVLVKNINDTMHQYTENEDAKQAIDFLQSKLFCCGYNSYHDWDEIGISENIELPKSCRAMDNVTDFFALGYGYSIYETGCVRNLSIIIHRSALYIGTGAVAIALIQFTGIMFACILGKAIRRQKTERERRRWELRESLVNGYEPLGKSDPFTTFPVVYSTYPEPTKTIA